MVNLTIGGGNFKGISYVGALEYLYQNNLINKIDNFYGSSIGSVIGLFFIIGYKPYEIFEIILNFNLNDYWDLNFDNLQKSFSLITDKIFKKFKELFSLKEKSNITFIEFYKKYNIKLNLFATSLNQRKNICFNVDNYPNYEVFNILQASCSIPLIFPPVKINNELYVDGCIKCIDGVCKNYINDDKINFIIKGDYSNRNIETFTQYIEQVINCIIQNDEETITDYTINIKTLSEYDNKVSFGTINHNDKLKLFYHGLSEAKEKISAKISDFHLKINEEILNETLDKINKNFEDREDREDREDNEDREDQEDQEDQEDSGDKNNKSTQTDNS